MSIRATELEESLRLAFQAQDVERVLELDQLLLALLKELRQKGFTLPFEQWVRLKSLYQAICTTYKSKHRELSDQLSDMRQNQSALRAYQKCQTAGY